MPVSSVNSLRIGRGRYRSDPTRSTVVTAVAELLSGTAEGEIERLGQELARIKREMKEMVEQEVKAHAEETYSQGFQAGYAKCREEQRATVDEALAIIEQLGGEIEIGVRAVWNDCRETVARLALVIARKVVGVVAQQHEGLALEMAKRALSMVKDQVKIRIAVNPEDANVVRAAQGELLSSTEGVKRIEIVERTSVPRGGVVIETDIGQLEARLEEQLEVVKTALVPAWSHPEPEQSHEQGSVEDARPE